MRQEIARRVHREGIADLFQDPAVKHSVAIDIQLIDEYDRIIDGMKDTILSTARNHDAQAVSLLRSVPGIGKTLSLVILYEIHAIDRFERVQDLCSYARLVKCVTPTYRPKIRMQSDRNVTNLNSRIALA